MRRPIYFLIILVIAQCSLPNQVSAQLSIGPRLLINKMQVYFSDEVSFAISDDKINFEFGAKIGYRISNNFSIASFLTFGNKNYLAHDSGFIPLKKITFKQLNSTITFNYHLRSDLEFDIGLNYLLLTDIKEHRLYIQSQDFTNINDFGLYLGSNYSLYNIELGLAYRLGVYNSQKTLLNIPNSPLKPLNFFQFSISYLFHIDLSANESECPKF